MKKGMDVVDFTVTGAGFLVGELAEMEIQSDELTAKMNSELDGIRARYEPKLQNLRGNINIRRDALEQWAEAHKDLFKEKRSIEFERGTIGFRVGQPQLKVLAKRTWEKVKELLCSDKDLIIYTRANISVAKDLILADRDNLSDEKLKKIGVKVVQEDTFYCEVKKDEPTEVPESGKAA